MTSNASCWPWHSIWPSSGVFDVDMFTPDNLQKYTKRSLAVLQSEILKYKTESKTQLTKFYPPQTPP